MNIDAKQLVADLVDVIRFHDLEDEDARAADLCQLADEMAIEASEDNDAEIEAIRQENLHPLSP